MQQSPPAGAGAVGRPLIGIEDASTRTCHRSRRGACTNPKASGTMLPAQSQMLGDAPHAGKLCQHDKAHDQQDPDGKHS